MHARPLSVAAFVAFLAMAPGGAHAQATYKQLPVTNEAYVKPFPPLRIVGNLYYVGTYDLAVYLITTSAGNILINTGINDSVAGIRSNIEALGFRFADIKLLLATHGHWDHVAGMAEIKRLTGARMLMHEDDAPMLEDGGNSDYRYLQGRGPIYEAVAVDQRLKDGDKVRLGDTELTVLHHPGHTKGATSFTFTTRDRGRDYSVLIANMASINPGVMVGGMPGFPGITQAYTQTLAKQKQLKPDIWVASHAAQFNLHQKYKPGDPYDPNRFVDPDGYQAKLQFYEKLVRANLGKDQ
ncbi:MAG TPA: subclass B3 metallo-beta-lactamase [Burkholderiales bacterium]|jgi:metallo-beta-lactamase class B|nr:subclass B3 metallo-beta-lactamase [Burkholderiales bacterium]